MNQSIITGLGTPQLSRIIEQGQSHSRRTQQQSSGRRAKSGEKYQNEEELDQIEEEIKQIGKQLENLHFQMKKMKDKYSEQYLEKENHRNNLRKQLIDLDYRHKTIFARKIKTNNGCSIINQFFDKKIEETYEPRLEQRNQQKQGSQNKLTKYESSIGSYKTEDKKNQSGLEQSVRRLRIAEIESQLAEDKLRRSKIEILTQELDYLRTSYSYPNPIHDYYSEYYYPTYSSLYSAWWFY